jgi:hypothetical protein
MGFRIQRAFFTRGMAGRAGATNAQCGSRFTGRDAGGEASEAAGAEFVPASIKLEAMIVLIGALHITDCQGR